MKATWKIWAAAVMAVVGMIPVGCGGSVIIGGQDPECPATAPKAGEACSVAASGCAYQEGPCKDTLSCDAVTGAWQSTALTCAPMAKDCWSASDGDVCAVVGESCGEGSSPCSYFSNTCGEDHFWHSLSTGGGEDCCSYGGVCPAVQPQEGDYCDPCNTQLTCDYPGTCGGAFASCGPDGLWHIAISDCPPPPTDYCNVNGNQSACETDPGCRWLTPGCDPTGVSITGCFTTDECTSTSCAPGLMCQSVVYNPCFGKNCDACGAHTTVCLQYAL